MVRGGRGSIYIGATENARLVDESVQECGVSGGEERPRAYILKNISKVKRTTKKKFVAS